jgi:hypothetical protein
MPGIVAALIARNDIESIREQINNLPFSLVAPLCADDHYYHNSLGLTDPPLVGEQAVDSIIVESPASPLGLSQDTFFLDAETLRNGSASHIFGGASDLDAI